MGSRRQNKESHSGCAGSEMFSKYASVGILLAAGYKSLEFQRKVQAREIKQGIKFHFFFSSLTLNSLENLCL